MSIASLVEATTGVNQSPKNFSPPNPKSPSPIRTLFGQTTFSWIVFGQVISFENLNPNLNLVKLDSGQTGKNTHYAENVR